VKLDISSKTDKIEKERKIMKIWLDDERDPKCKRIQEQFGSQGDEIWIKNANDAIQCISQNIVESISLDHDLGENSGSGIEVANFIEEQAFLGNLKRFKWKIHSMNPVGRVNMARALDNAEKFWSSNHE
jgi:hypothetical protein